MLEQNTIIIPDVHCRDYWKEPVTKELNENDNQIIFLGDYLDGYQFDFEEGFNYREFGIKQLEEIIELKKKYPERIELLIGNHDLGYVDPYICRVRRDWEHYEQISKIFRENLDLFNLAKEVESGDKKFLLSHAGICDSWSINACESFEIDMIDLTSFKLNEEFHSQNSDKIFKLLRHVGFLRGGGEESGSIIWADIREHRHTSSSTWTKTHNCQQIVGHTYLKSPMLIDDTVYCLDCKRVFKLEDGKISDYLENNKDIIAVC